VSHFLRELWHSSNRPEVFRRSVVVALVVGTLLTLVNELDVLLGTRSDPLLALRLLANYAIPFVVSNLGAMVEPPKG
jgi:hypothetical protein